MHLDTIERQVGAADEPVRASVIVLHGLGADATDFLPIGADLDLSAVGALRFVFPSAPPRAVTVSGGFVTRAWYDILGADFTRRREDEAARVAGRRAGDDGGSAWGVRNVACCAWSSRLTFLNPRSAR